MNNKYIFLGETLDFGNFRLSSGGIYYGDLIEELLKNYPLLSKILIKVEELPEYEKNTKRIKLITEEIKKQIEEGGNNGL